MLSEITARELHEWEAYSRLEPFGFQRDNLVQASLRSTIVNSISRALGGHRVFPPRDFVMDFRPPPSLKDKILAGLGIGGKR